MFQQHDFCTNSGYQGLMVAISTGPALNIGQLRRPTTFAVQTQGSIDRYGHAGVFQLLDQIGRFGAAFLATPVLPLRAGVAPHRLDQRSAEFRRGSSSPSPACSGVPRGAHFHPAFAFRGAFRRSPSSSRGKGGCGCIGAMDEVCGRDPAATSHTRRRWHAKAA